MIIFSAQRVLICLNWSLVFVLNIVCMVVNLFINSQCNSSFIIKWHQIFIGFYFNEYSIANINLHINMNLVDGPSCPWSYCSWIYNYSTYAISAYHHWCEFESRSGRGVQHYVIKFVSDLRQVGGFLRVLQFPQPIKLTAMI